MRGEEGRGGTPQVKCLTMSFRKKFAKFKHILQDIMKINNDLDFV